MNAEERAYLRETFIVDLKQRLEYKRGSHLRVVVNPSADKSEREYSMGAATAYSVAVNYLEGLLEGA